MTSVWRRQERISRALATWALGSIAVGGGLWLDGARADDARRRALGQQTLAWGAIDAGIAAFGDRRRRARLAGLDDPSDPTLQRRERSGLRRLLLVNAGLDVGYVAGGLAWRRRGDPASRGHGVAVVVQGGFLFVFDLWQARAVTRDPAVIARPGARPGSLAGVDAGVGLPTRSVHTA